MPRASWRGFLRLISAAELAGLDARTALARRPQPENPDQRSFIFQ